MRIAIAGKGGAGKTTFAATLARLEARRGAPVVALDGDSNPNLAAALGVDRDLAATVPALASTLVSRRLDGPALTTPVDEVVGEYGIPGPDGVRVLRMGQPAHADEGCMCSAHATVSALLGDLADRPEVVTVLDLEASPEHLGRGTARHADALVLVAEPYYRSLETVRRLAVLAAELPIPRVVVVANKVRSPDDADAVSAFCDRHGLEQLGGVPWSEEVVDADRAGIPLLDAAPESAAVIAIGGIAERLHQAVQLGRSPAGA